MANVFELFATLSLDDSRYREGLDDAESRGSRFGSGLRTAGRLATAAVAGATTAVVGFGVSSVKSGMDFDSAMSQVAATMGTTVDQIGDLRDFAQEMGSTTAFSATEAAEALNYMALAGYDAETSMEMLPNVLNLAASGNMDLAAASDMVTDSQTALGLTLDETNVLVDQMARTASTTNTSVSQLGDAILTVGGTAQFMSGGTTELNSVLGVLADNGIKGSEAGTHLRNMILSLSSPTDDARAQLEALGVQIFDAEGNMRDWSEIFPEMSAAMDDMTSEERITALGQIFNTRDVAAATALMSTSVDRWNEVGEAIDSAQGSAQAMAETQLDNLAGDITLFKSALEGAKIAISDQLTPQIRDFVGLATTGLSDVTAAFQEGGLEGAMTAVGTWLSDAITMVTTSLPELVRLGGDLLISLVTGVVENLPEIATAAVDVILTLATGIGDAAPDLIPAVVDAILIIVTTLTSPDSITTITDAAIQLIGGISIGIARATPDIVRAIPVLVTNLTKGLIDCAPDIIAAALEVCSEVRHEVDAAVIEAFMGIVQDSQEAGDQILDNFFYGIEGIKGFFTDAWSFITDGFSSLSINFPQISLPHFTFSGGEAPYGIGGAGSPPQIGIQWYARGYETAMMLDSAAIFGAAGGKLLGGGERGPEYVVGEDRLRKLIAENSATTIVVPVYIEGDKIDEFVVNSKQRTDYIGGGRG